MTSSTVAVSGRFLRSFTAPCMVMDMLVPVSPSGTGNTFNESTKARFFSSSAAPARNMSLSRAPSIVSVIKFVSSRAA